MLTTVAPQRASRQLSKVLGHSYEQLHLPWLCPALYSGRQRKARHVRHSSNSALPLPPRRARVRSSSPSSGGQSKQRRLASITGSSSYDTTDDHIPFVVDGHLSPKKDASLADLRPWDPSKLLHVTITHEPRVPSFKSAPGSAMTGDVVDLQQNLYACCQVGHIIRASEILRRLRQIYTSDAPELREAHQQYLQGSLTALLASPSRDKYHSMAKWLELEVKGRGVEITSGMLAVLIKAAFAVLEGSKLERTVRRYLSYAEQRANGLEMATFKSHLFTTDEYTRIRGIAPHRVGALDLTHSATTTGLEPVEHIAVHSSVDESQPRRDTQTISVMEDREQIPEIRSIEQKGSGLETLQLTLGALHRDYWENTGMGRDISSKPLEDQIDRQKKLESRVLELALQRWRAESEKTQQMRILGTLKNPSLGSLVHDWITGMVALVKEEIRFVQDAEGKVLSVTDADRMLIGPFLHFSAPERLCAAAIMAWLGVLNDQKTQNPAEVDLTKMIMRVGGNVTTEITYQLVKLKVKILAPLEQRRQLAKLEATKGARQASVMKEILEYTADVDTLDPAHLDSDKVVPGVPQLTKNICAKVGAFFLSLIIKVARMPISTTSQITNETITQVFPIMSQSKTWRNGKRLGTIKTHMAFLERIKKEPVHSFIAKHLPMVVPPKEWKSIGKGPYYKTFVSAVRFKDVGKSQKAYVNFAVARGDMKQVFAGLDVIGKVPWNINKSVFKVLAECWNTGEALAGLPPENPVPDYPPEPDRLDGYSHRRWRMVMREINNEITGFHSQRCSTNFQLECARAYLNETFYCPHNVDFRGRAYPIPPYLNHMGADHIRGLFVFAQGKELGESGLFWLKIHLANVFGFDKESLTARAQFAEEHLSDIYDSAHNPMTGRRWWMKSEDAFQTLAACIELTAALDSPVPSKYVSHLPVQQDGSCNGLQHYAALGGDMIGARQVNLMPGDKPSDIYSGVANLVRESISKAARENYLPASVLDGHISRKVVKQPVMTNVYGVTYHGARAQVRKQLIDILPRAALSNNVNPGQLAGYVATEIFGALSKMFNGAHNIQVWLGECGARISQAITPEQIARIQSKRAGTESEKSRYLAKPLKADAQNGLKEDCKFKSTIVWTTPLGLPVVQPYRVPKTRTIQTTLQAVKLAERTLADPVSLRKQLQAFPPNFIHSLDATHMMLSALKCDEIGLTFAAVHDSFWTHAADVPIMNRVLRDAFVRMHSEDIIGRLREEFIARYGGCYYLASIRADGPTANKINELRQSRGAKKTHFAKATVESKAQIDELLLEYERQQLLKSEDPEKQAQGRAMLTPASIVEGERGSDQEMIYEGEAVQRLGERQAAGDAADPVDAKVAEKIAGADDDDEDVSVERETDADDDAVAESLDDAGASDLQGAESKEVDKKKCKPPSVGKLHFWMPIAFPPAPQRGEFDVSKLKDSQYFFS